MKKKLAIIGGGAKGVAIACKAALFREAGLFDWDVDVFEPLEIGSSWTGNHGYTDGRQLLCTPAEKDLGYPYSFIDVVGAEQVASHMMRRFSWAAYKTSDAVGAGASYSDWVTEGRRAPTHRNYSAYLAWAFERSGASLRREGVTSLVPTANRPRRWLIHTASPSQPPQEYSAVVVTGHGPARRLQSPVGSTTVFDGKDFWDAISQRRLVKYLRGRAPAKRKVAVIGSGGTAASILGWFARNGFEAAPISLLSGQATLHTRGNGIFENRLFDNADHWGLLTKRTRKEFVDRLTRGVVWESTMEELRKLTAIEFVEGRADRIVTIPGSSDLKVEYTVLDGKKQLQADLEASVVVDATGFDPWWFLPRLPAGSIPQGGREQRRFKERMTTNMKADLSFGTGWPLPRMHAPAHSLMIGPGLASLLSLGDMADRILVPYLAPP